MGINDDVWQRLFREAEKAILAYFKGEAGDKEAWTKARMATSVLSSFTRHEATESAKQTTGVLVAKQLSSSAEEFRLYLEYSAPQISLPNRPTVEEINRKFPARVVG